MAQRFRYIVIGRGIMGSAAAKYLARQSDGVALIGPNEPSDLKIHQGVFASHYDEARITRTIDPDSVWARLASRSIARYGEIARDSGVDFYVEAGSLLVGARRGGSDPYVGNVCAAGARLGVPMDVLDDGGLAERFSYFSFGSCREGVFERENAGYVNPRQLVRAQSVLAGKAGATLVAEIAAEVREEGGGVAVRTAEGGVYRADKVIVAAGGFSIAEKLLPQKIDLKVYARTVAFFEIDEAKLRAYAGMPSLIYKPDDPRDHIYLLPPVRYPDGKVYLKIGGDPDDLALESESDVRAWFRSGGRESVRLHLKRIIDGLMPSLAETVPTMAACVTSFTPTGYPAIGYAGSERIAVLTGGCGAAAKSSDEIGRLGAELLLAGGIDDPAYETDFQPVFL